MTKFKDGTGRKLPPPDGICTSEYHYVDCGRRWRCPSQELREKKNREGEAVTCLGATRRHRRHLYPRSRGWWFRRCMRCGSYGVSPGTTRAEMRLAEQLADIAVLWEPGALRSLAEQQAIEFEAGR